MSDVWAFCSTCDRWYYCEDHGTGNRDMFCPVCRTEPSHVEDRAAPSEVTV